MASRSKPAVQAGEDQLVASLIALMEQGTAPWRREWDGCNGAHHVNLISGRPYRGANPILLTIDLHQRGMALPYLPYWCGAAEARRHGLLPKNGSQAVTVLRPQLKGPKRGTVKREMPSALAETTLEERRPEHDPPASAWVRYVPVSLFNAGDLEGEALAGLIGKRQTADQLSRRPEPARLAKADAVLHAWPVPMALGGRQAFYTPQVDRIQLPDRCSFHSSAAFYATWAHEALHSTGHPSRLGRNLSNAVGSQAYAREELLAELGAVLLGDRLEIGSNVGNHAAYLSEWISLLKESPTLLYKLLSEARRAADLICPAEPFAGGDLTR